MLRLNEFELATPETIDEAVSILRANRDCLIVAGGTDLVPKLKRGQFEPPVLISLSGIKDLAFIRWHDDRLRIGSGTTLKTIERSEDIRDFDSLRQAVRQVATPIIRNSATIGGNLLQDTRCRYYDRSLFWRDAVGYCMKKSGEDCWVAPGGNKCFATLCSDLAPALIVHDAEVELVGEDARTIALEDLYRDDGMANLNMNNEILAAVIVSKQGYRSTYKKLRIRDGFDFPEVGVAVAIKDNGKTIRVNIAATGVSSDIYTLKEEVKREDVDAVIERAYKSIKPLDTMFFPPAYRKKIARAYLIKSFDELLAS
jgi:4-hydroxybenzoyl-CoA reductase subunit beta